MSEAFYSLRYLSSLTRETKLNILAFVSIFMVLCFMNSGTDQLMLSEGKRG